MPTVKTRINITLSDNARDALVKIARKDRIPPATKASRLLEMALELEEDQVWDAIARSRDVKNARYFLHHKTWR